jgi:mannose-6-phosphate isomerase-like protein (cupin superfamily)
MLPMTVVEVKLPESAIATKNVPIGILCYYQQLEIIMNESKDYPYATHLNIYYQPLEIVNVPELAAACTDQWYNQTLCRVNDSVVRLGVIKGEYHWHKHDNDDEFFFVIEGRLFVDLEERIVDLEPRQGLVVPKGIMHRTRAPERTVMLAFENAGIVPTGDP